LPPEEPSPVSIPDTAWLEVHFVDVGQGDGIWIQTHDDGVDGNSVFEGRHIVIDGGPDASDEKNQMRIYLEARGHHGAVIDALILTHPHDDHYPGAEGILRHFDVLRYYDPGYPKGGVAYPAFLDEVRAEVTQSGPIKAMIGKDAFEPLERGKEVQAEILFSFSRDATEAMGTASNTKENNASIVIRLAYGRHVFLFMGDAEGKERDGPADVARFVEKSLLESARDKLDATVLKVGHHGSESSSTLPFLEAVSPEVVVVCSGRRSFGGTYLPDEGTLRRFCETNPSVRICRTDQGDEEEGRTAKNDADGDHVIVRTNGDSLDVIAFWDGEPHPIEACGGGD
jgi:competence protein ComEC